MSKYSIILPVRNGGEYIKECIKSILSQTLTDFNLIVLENFSTDGTKEWIQSLNDNRVVIIPAEKPLSMEENWRRVVSISRNEFMTMLGADDILYPNYLATLDALINKHPSASLYQAHFRFIDSDGKTIRDSKPVKEFETVSEFLYSICYHRTSIMGTGFMTRTIDYDSVGGIPMYPNLLFADFELWLELTRINYKATSQEFAFSYRVHPESTTASSSFDKYAAGFEKMMIYFKKLKEKDNDIATFIDNNWIQFINFYCRGSAHKLLRTPRNMRGGMTVKSILARYKSFAGELVPYKKYDPTASFSIWLALLIDSNRLTRELFLLFKKIYSKPIYR